MSVGQYHVHGAVPCPWGSTMSVGQYHVRGAVPCPWGSTSVPRETPLSIKTFRVVTFLVQNLVLKMKIAIRNSQIYFLSSPHATFDGVTSGLNCPLNTSYSKKEVPFFFVGAHFNEVTNTF